MALGVQQLDDVTKDIEALFKKISTPKNGILAQLATIFCMDKSLLSPEEPVMNYGVDSLMAVEMVNWAKAELGISISQIDVLGGLSVNQLLTKAGLSDEAQPVA